jgi:hypothetical protein
MQPPSLEVGNPALRPEGAPEPLAAMPAGAMSAITETARIAARKNLILLLPETKKVHLRGLRAPCEGAKSRLTALQSPGFQRLYRPQTENATLIRLSKGISDVECPEIITNLERLQSTAWETL